MKILKWFNNNYKNLINDMKNTSHNLSDFELSPYHAEGSVWTHTMMVYSHLDINASNELRLAVLLHDIGKPYSQVIREGKGRVSFTGHEHYSSFLAIDVLNKFEKDFVTFLDKKNILFAINYHDILHKAMKHNEDGTVYLPEDKKIQLNKMFANKLDLYELLFDLSYVDMKGRISEDMVHSINKYNYLRNFIPYVGEENKKDKKLFAYFMIGLPGSGKSTMVKSIKRDNPNIKVLSVDEEIIKLGKYSITYDGAWSVKRQKEASNIVFNKMLECIKNKESFILDAAHLSTKIRRRKLNAIPNNYTKVANLQLASLSFISEVMKNRKDKSISIDIIKDMSKDFTYPTYEEFDHIYTQILPAKKDFK